MNIVEVNVDALVDLYAHSCKALGREAVCVCYIRAGVPFDALKVNPGII